MKDKTIVVWFSCGVASAVALKETLRIYGKDNKVIAVNTSIDEELTDNIRFLRDVEKWLGVTIQSAKNSKLNHSSAEAVWLEARYMSGILGAPCTGKLKKEARYEFERKHNIDYHVLGFTVDEWQRQKRFNQGERDNTLPVLVTSLITKKECFLIVESAGVDIPLSYKLGYLNANCVGCVKSSSPRYWNRVRVTHPDVFLKRAALSREIGCKLVEVRKKRIFLDELDPNLMTGKETDVECSIFCNPEFVNIPVKTN
jgi:hypothetical protein